MFTSRYHVKITAKAIGETTLLNLDSDPAIERSVNAARHWLDTHPGAESITVNIARRPTAKVAKRTALIQKGIK